MEQKKVKIIGLKINEAMGILQSCELHFNPDNHLIAFKGEVGSGKTTMQKALMLATQGSDTLKDDKQLYGAIDEEVQLIDGDKKIFIGCKSNKDGSLAYTIYTKDDTGKIVKDPVIDGIKQTPAAYLKELQTALTWRMDELMSENPTVQKKILLELYKSELAKLGVVYDKKSADYSKSILGQIEIAEAYRSEKDFARKQVGGFQNQLEAIGIDVDTITLPVTRINIAELEEKKNRFKFEIDNFSQRKEQRLQAIKNSADSIILQIKEWNEKQKVKQKEINDAHFKNMLDWTSKNESKETVEKTLSNLAVVGALTYDFVEKIKEAINGEFFNNKPIEHAPLKMVEFDEQGKVKNNASDFEDVEVSTLLTNLEVKKQEYIIESKAEKDDTSLLEKQIEEINVSILQAKEINKRSDMIESYIAWHDAHKKVIELKNEYANLLGSINTGVDGLQIHVDKEGESLDVYLTYNGKYDPSYFSNIDMVPRKLSSYSGTQKPLICLLLQNYLLSKKPKAMRYLFIDNVPIDNKTKILLNRMGDELGVVIIVNITGDFTKENLESGEILIEGGEVFF